MLRAKNNVSTYRATGPTTATASSACSALSLAAYAASFHARQPVAANKSWHSVDGGNRESRKSGAVKHERVLNNSKVFTPKESGLNVSAQSVISVTRPGNHKSSPCDISRAVNGTTSWYSEFPRGIPHPPQQYHAPVCESWDAPGMQP